MGGTRTKVALAATCLVVAGTASAAVAGVGTSTERASLNSFAEVPTLSTRGIGTFSATINSNTNRIRYTLQYRALSTAVQQAHIHLGRTATVGGISAFLCTNIGGGTPQTPACPRRGVVRGVLGPGSVEGPTAQGIGAGQFNALAKAMRQGAAYVNVHSARFPSGEIRGAIR
jgi:hypothetical protein